MQVQFAAQSYPSRVTQLDAQRCINMYVERSPPDAQTQVPVLGCPGMRQLGAMGTGPIFGMHVMNNVQYVVSGQQLFSLNPDGGTILIGSVGVSGLVSMADNGQQVVMVDGQTGWIYQPGGIGLTTSVAAAFGDQQITVSQITGTVNVGDILNIPLDSGAIQQATVTSVSGTTILFAGAVLLGPVSVGAVVKDLANVVGQITSPNFLPAYTVCYFDGYFIFSAVGSNQFFLSALFDGTMYSTLDRASAEANSDYVQAVVNFHEQLLIFGQVSTEFWYNSGGVTFPFSRFDGAYLQRGLASPRAVCQEDNTVFWLGEDGIFYRLDKFSPVRISTHGCETAWEKYATINDAIVFNYTLAGHKMIVVTFPNAPDGGATWVWDISSGLWHERESWSTQNTTLGRWRVNCAANIFGEVLLGDSILGVVAVADFDVFTEYGNTMRALIVSPPIQKDRKRVFMSRFEIAVQAGVGLTTGQGSDPQVMLDWSDDGGVTWSMLQKWRSMGRIGEYLQRLRWLKMGQSRERVLRLQITDPVRRNIISVNLDIKPGMG